MDVKHAAADLRHKERSTRHFVALVPLFPRDALDHDTIVVDDASATDIHFSMKRRCFHTSCLYVVGSMDLLYRGLCGYKRVPTIFGILILPVRELRSWIRASYLAGQELTPNERADLCLFD